MKQHLCFRCGGPTVKAFYMGFTGNMCRDEECATMDGLAAEVAAIWFVGPICFYEGSYWKVLWSFLKGDFSKERA